ncbi:PREDICTED: histone acetyltransferase KAT6B-like [Tarenaya hassleriana]|uniref:histone acetyltransferase KAT6B-like n=1 Tax=Tarenaya hassleriana TaxID=28532 RepID=UPI00053C48F6|nr:PREDICTED: histone acetyltransferase KAT6B-like [Tarenaya hassleriana]
MPAFGSQHMTNPRDLPHSGEIGAAGDSSDTESLSDLDLERGGMLHSGGKKRRRKKKSKGGRDCRICHLALEDENGGGEEEEDDDDDEDSEEEEDEEGEEEEEEECYGLPLQLGCSCKGDLGVAHSKCAETWFKIKGNLTCEICGATALNVAGEQSNLVNAPASSAAAAQPLIQTESRGTWHGHRLMNFLLAGMVFAFIVSWLFHFKVLK